MIPSPYIKPSDDFFEPNQRLKIKKHFDVAQVSKILIRGIDPLGDIAIGSAFYRETRRLFPNAYIAVMLSAHAAQFLKHCPYIDEVIIFDKKQQWQHIKQLKAQQFDLALLLTGNLRAALIAYLAGIPNRVGFDTDGRGFLLTVQLSCELHNRYRGENHFDLLRAIGLNPQGVFKREVWLTEEEHGLAAKQWQPLAESVEQEILAFNPFARVQNRRWSGQNWQKLLQSVLKKGIFPVMFVGPNETEEAKQLLTAWGLSEIPVVEAHLMITAAMLKWVKWVVGTDSGFIHLALAVNKPHVIAIYGLLPVNSSFPIYDKHHKGLIADHLPCAPCYLYKASDQCFNKSKCMKEITAEQVERTMSFWD